MLHTSGVIKYWDVCQSGSIKSTSYLTKLNLELSPHAICNIQFTSVRKPLIVDSCFII